MVKINSVMHGSLCDKHGIQSGDTLVRINGHDIKDVLDYMYYAADTDITLSSGTARRFAVWGAVQVGGTPTSIENAVVNENKAVKQIMNGQVIIIRNGVRYNVIGQVIE